MKRNSGAETREASGKLTSPATSGEAAVPASSLTGPRRETLWAAVTYAVFTMSLGFPALAGKFLVGPNSDQYIAGYAFREFAASTLRTAGHFPLWNPYLFGGLPFVAAMHGDIFYPTFLLRMLLPTDAAMTWGFIIHVFLAGLFTFLFLRASGFGFFGSLFGGVAYMMGGQVASLVSPGHDGKLYVSALFPLTLLILTRGIRDGKRWSWGLLALVIGLAVVSPHPQVLQYLLLASAAYALFLAISGTQGGRLPARDAAIRIGLALGAVAIGGLVGAIQYLPVREYVAWSPRAGGLADYARATSYAWPPSELFNSYLPQFTGILCHGSHPRRRRVRGTQGKPATPGDLVLDWHSRDGNTLGAWRSHAFLPHSVRDHSRNQILPRTQQRLFRWVIRDCISGCRRSRARARPTARTEVSLRMARLRISHRLARHDWNPDEHRGRPRRGANG